MSVTRSVCNSVLRIERGWGIKHGPAHITGAPTGAEGAADSKAPKALVPLLASKETSSSFERGPFFANCLNGLYIVGYIFKGSKL